MWNKPEHASTQPSLTKEGVAFVVVVDSDRHECLITRKVRRLHTFNTPRAR